MKAYKKLNPSPCQHLIGLMTLVAIWLSSCSSPSNTSSESDSTSADSIAVQETAVAPKGPKPDWAPDIKPEMQAVMEQLASFKDKPIPELSPAEARKNHTPADAVKAIIDRYNITVPLSAVDTTGQDIPVAGGKIHARIYTPKGSGPFPVIVYYHGGGFVIADLDVYDSSAKALAEQVNAIVVSVAYRLAPEHKFPTAHMDSFAAYEWVTKNTASIKGDPKKLAVAGESAGGNLAINMAIMARDRKISAPVHILAVYPIAQSDMNTPSYVKNAAAKPLDKPMMAWFTKHYLNNMAEAKDPKISLVNAKLNDLAPVTIITSSIDPLQSDGIMLAEKLKAAGVNVDMKNYVGVTHEFFGMAAVVPEAKDAQSYAAEQLRKAFK